MAYIADGLDEAASSGLESGQPTIVSILLRCAREAPPWLVFVITSRSEMHASALADSVSAADADGGLSSSSASVASGGGAESRTIRLAFPGCSAVVPAACVINLDDSKNSAGDVAEYIHARVHALPRLQAFSGAAAAQLAAASGSNFQFARAVLDLAAEQSWSPEQVRQLVVPSHPPSPRSTSPRTSRSG